MHPIQKFKWTTVPVPASRLTFICSRPSCLQSFPNVLYEDASGFHVAAVAGDESLKQQQLYGSIHCLRFPLQRRRSRSSSSNWQKKFRSRLDCGKVCGAEKQTIASMRSMGLHRPWSLRPGMYAYEGQIACCLSQTFITRLLPYWPPRSTATCYHESGAPCSYRLQVLMVGRTHDQDPIV